MKTDFNCQHLETPESDAELKQRLDLIAGLTLGDVAKQLGAQLPKDLHQSKGLAGQLVEHALGTDAGNLSQPDFIKLGIELKTLPIDSKGRPMESTYVSVVPLMSIASQPWQESVVFAKLRRVLWLPIESDATIPLARRRIGQGVLWQPQGSVVEQIAADYEHFRTQISLGEIESITAHQGQWLQIRPKAANNSALTDAVGSEGKVIKTLPRGFYLRPALTRRILAEWHQGLHAAF